MSSSVGDINTFYKRMHVPQMTKVGLGEIIIF